MEKKIYGSLNALKRLKYLSNVPTLPPYDFIDTRASPTGKTPMAWTRALNLIGIWKIELINEWQS